jgi:hypothetical protein
MKMIFKHLVSASKKTHHVTITKFSWFMLFKEIISVQSENHTKTIIHSVGSMHNYWLAKKVLL